MDLPKKPDARRDFHVAIICALTLEADMVEILFDKIWSNKYGRAASDSNAYTTGAIAGHNVVLAYCPGIGKNAATRVAANLKTSFTGIKLVLVVGICGAVPFYQIQEDETEEIVLGDCIISTSIIQFDFGRLGPDGFEKKDGLDGRGLANSELRGLMAKLKSRKNVADMTRQLERHLKAIQKEDPKRSQYPGYADDRLYQASYIHTHHAGLEKCSKCNLKLGICAAECKTLDCSDAKLIKRDRLGGDTSPRLHFGCFGSSDTVLKSGSRREELAEAHEIIAFEMEGTGVWDIFPTIVIKAACDYADSHKNKRWQGYAAAVAASAAKALIGKLELSEEEAITPDVLAQALQRLERMSSSLVSQSKTFKRFNTVPFPRDTNFVGRDKILDIMFSKLQTREPFYQPRVGLVGMGGIGKSQIAIEYAYRSMEENPNHSVFWVFAATPARFEQSYLDIALQAELKTSETTGALQAVRQWLSDEKKDWTLILDNLDSDRMLIESSSGGKSLIDYLPIADFGTILVTSRSRAAVNDLVSIKNVLLIEPMDEKDSIQLLHHKTKIDDEEAAKKLIRAVEKLPLAIAHAGSFIASRAPMWTVSKYLQRLETERSQVEILYSATLSDNRRDSSSARTIQATFQISFIAISQENPGAARLLSLMSMFQNQHIPEELFDSNQGSDIGEEDCINVLEKYSLVVYTTREDPVNPSGTSTYQTISIHRAVHVSLRLWLETKGELEYWQSKSIIAVEAVFPSDQAAADSQALSQRLLPHAEQVASYGLQLADSIDKVSLDRDRTQVRLMIAMIQYWQDVGQDSEHRDFFEAAWDLCRQVYPVDSTYNLILARHRNDLVYESGMEEKAIVEHERLIAIAGYCPQKEIYFLLRKDLVEFILHLPHLMGKDKHLEKAISLAENSLSELDRITMHFWSRYRFSFALLLANLLQEEHGFSKAELVLSKAIAEMALHSRDSIYWDLTSQLADVTRQKGDRSKARKLYSDIIKSEAYEHDSQKSLRNRRELARVLYEQRRISKAIKLQSSLVNDSIRITGEASKATFYELQIYAIYLFNGGQRDEGLEILQRAGEIAQVQFGPNGKETLYIIRHKISFLESLERWEEAEALWSAILKAQETEPSSYYPQIRDCLCSLTEVLEKQGKWEEAEQLHRRIFDGPSGGAACGLTVPHSRNEWNRVQTRGNRISRDELETRFFKNLVKQAKYEDFRAIYLRLLGYSTTFNAYFEYTLSQKLFALNARDQAFLILRSALDTTLTEDDHFTIKLMLTTLIYELESDQRWKEAEPLYQQLFKVRNDLDDDPGNMAAMAEDLMDLSANLLKQRKLAEAEKLIRRVSCGLEMLYGSDSRLLRILFWEVGEFLMTQHQYEEADKWYHKALVSAPTDDIAILQFRIGIAQYMQELYSRAEDTFLAVLRLQKDDQSEEHVQNETKDSNSHQGDFRENRLVKYAQAESRHSEHEEDETASNSSLGTNSTDNEGSGHKDETVGSSSFGTDSVDIEEHWRQDARFMLSTKDAKFFRLSRRPTLAIVHQSLKTGNSGVAMTKHRELSRSAVVAIWLHASIRAQHGDPSKRVAPDLQSRFDTLIAKIRKLPSMEQTTFRPPFDPFEVWTVSHELRTQKNYKGQQEFEKRHGLNGSCSGGISAKGVASSRSSSCDSIAREEMT